jgi:conjugative transfer region lipoprotein (TIGR03751 family)
MTRRVPDSPISMEGVYNQAINGHNSESLNVLRQSTLPSFNATENTRISLVVNSNNPTQFSRVSNPDVLLYVYPHIVGEVNAGIPVPGYYSSFPLYTHVYYQSKS